MTQALLIVSIKTVIPNFQSRKTDISKFLMGIQVTRSELENTCYLQKYCSALKNKSDPKFRSTITVLFPKAFHLTAVKKLHEVSYPFIEMFDTTHQLDYVTISTQNLFHYLYFCLYCSLFLFLFPFFAFPVFFSISHLFSLYPPSIPHLLV